jgi:ClpP class serine protease
VVTDGEREKVKERILHTYDMFVKKVSEGRDLSEEHVHDVGQGRIWMGGDAIERGLCDEFGTLEDAIREARAQAGLKPDEEVVITQYPEPPPLVWPRMYPEVPGLRSLAGLLFGTPYLGSEEDEKAGLEYELEYLKAMAKNPGRPLVLTPPEMVPEEWTQP